MAEVNFKIVEKGAVLGTQGTYTLEVNKVSWYNKEAKWDIRPWNEDHTQCGKGITLTDEQLDALGNFINYKVQGGN